MKDMFKPRNIKYVNTSYNISTDDDTVNVDTSVGPCRIVLPNIASHGLYGNPKRFYINDIAGNAANNNITIIALSGDLVNGAPTLLLNTNNVSGEILVCNLNEYICNSNNAVASPVATTLFVKTETADNVNYIGGLTGITSYSQLLNKPVVFQIASINTGSGGAFININGLGNIPFVKFGNAPMDANDFKTNQYEIGIYDGTNFQLISITDNISQGN